MADYDSNLIKPVEGLQNIAGLGPVKRRKQRSDREKENTASDGQDNSGREAETEPEDRVEDRNHSVSSGIDYCA
jgi:hypothetical protein